jgi:hypothetical protein
MYKAAGTQCLPSLVWVHSSTTCVYLFLIRVKNYNHRIQLQLYVVCRSLHKYRCVNFKSYILSRVRGSVTNNNGFWIGWLNVLALLLQLRPTITAHNPWLRLALFLTGLRASSLLRDWLGSDLRVGHFFSFWRQRVNTPQLNTELSYECWMIGLPWNQSHVTTDGQSVSLSWNKAPIWGLRPSFLHNFVI